MKKAIKRTGKATKTENIVAQKEIDNKPEEKIPEELDNSSSITSISETTESPESLSGSSLEEVPNILESLYQTDSESTEDEEPEYVQSKSFLPDVDFFEIFENVPSLENISVDISVAFVPTEMPIISTQLPQQDVGEFVIPLTGLELKDSVESMSSSDEKQQEAKKSKEEQIEDKEMSDLEEILDREETKKPILIDDTLAAFLKLQMDTIPAKDKEIDWDALARGEKAKNLQKYTLKFLTDLINRVVEYSEDPEKTLQHNLDKRKLLLELAAKLPNYYSAKTQCGFLNRQVVHHFRRKKSFRSIIEDSPKTLQREKYRLDKAKDNLDSILSKEHTLIQHSEKLQDDLRQQYEKLKLEAESQIHIFESKVKSNLYRDKSPKLNANIDRLLLIMQKTRQEISAVRLSLLLRQHTAANLNEMIIKMEDLGNGLHMNSFTTLQAENQALDKKIEERNTELNKLYLRSHYEIHTLAHYKENQQMLYNTINIQRKILNNLTNERRATKERVLTLKLQRNRIHNQMRNVSAQGGILDKPALMYDYDNTAKLSEEKTKTVEILRKTLLSTQSKLDQILDCANLKCSVSYS